MATAGAFLGLAESEHHLLGGPDFPVDAKQTEEDHPQSPRVYIEKQVPGFDVLPYDDVPEQKSEPLLAILHPDLATGDTLLASPPPTAEVALHRGRISRNCLHPTAGCDVNQVLIMVEAVWNYAPRSSDVPSAVKGSGLSPSLPLVLHAPTHLLSGAGSTLGLRKN